MWGSAMVGDTYDSPEELDALQEPMARAIAKELSHHPLYKTHKGGLVNIVINLQPKGKHGPEVEEEEEAAEKKALGPFPTSGDGWFESHLGKSAAEVVKGLRKARRHNKDVKDDIDELIRSVRHLKELEVEETLKMHDWMGGRETTMRELGLTDRDLKSLRRFGDTRSISLSQACERWDEATGVIKALESVEEAWDEAQRNEWSRSMKMRTDARKAWRSGLHQMDKLTKHEQEWLNMAADELAMRGPMGARDMVSNMLGKDIGYHSKKSLTPRTLGSLLNTYGEELDIMKGSGRGQYVLFKDDVLVIKQDQVWPYAAGFLDADGYITITKRGEPRAGFIATGARGRIHCEQLHKTLGCGILQLDQKVYKDGQKSQHRLQFYSKGDMRKLLQGVTPHLQMKELQAKAVLAFLDADEERKSDLQRLVRYENWRDTKKGDELLDKWGVDAEMVGRWAEGL